MRDPPADSAGAGPVSGSWAGNMKFTINHKPSDFYERTFSRAGIAGPHTEHTLIVTAELTDGAAHSSTSIWSDPI